MSDILDSSGSAATCEILIDPSGIPTVKLIGELDIASAGSIRAVFDHIVANGPGRLIIDLSELRFIDSSGLSLFLAMADQIREVELRHPLAVIRRVIDLTGLSRVFMLEP